MSNDIVLAILYQMACIHVHIYRHCFRCKVIPLVQVVPPASLIVVQLKPLAINHMAIGLLYVLRSRQIEMKPPEKHDSCV